MADFNSRFVVMIEEKILQMINFLGRVVLCCHRVCIWTNYADIFILFIFCEQFAGKCSAANHLGFSE